jgi:hypothetical protein
MTTQIMDDRILRRSRRSFQAFVSILCDGVSKPTAKFIRSFLCGALFSGDLILTHVAGHVPDSVRLTATAKRFRRHLSGDRAFLLDVLGRYWGWLHKRLNSDSLFIVDLTDVAKPRARKLEYLATVRDGDTGVLVPGYWCLEVYVLDRQGVLWPVIVWPFSVEEEGQRSQPQQILDVLSILDAHFGSSFGVFVFDRGFDGRSYLEPFCEGHRQFVIRQRGDRMVVLPNGVHAVMDHVVDHGFAARSRRLIHPKVFLPGLTTPLSLVAYWHPGCDRPVMLLTNRCAETDELATQIRNLYVERWACETAIEFLKSKIGLEHFAVRRYRGMQRLIVLAALILAFLSFLESRRPALRQRLRDRLRYTRDPKRLWAFRLIEALRDALKHRCRRTLRPWCRPP